MPLDVKDFEFVQSFLRKRAAISLDNEKLYLVESRLQPLARREGFSSLGELVSKLKSSPVNGLHQKVVEAMTTHETSFFRDIHPFNAMRKSVLPELIASRSKTRALQIWCMACSTGQEPYSLAMLIREDFPELRNWKVSILATDLSTQILKKASDGVFSQQEINRGLPSPLLLKYFTRDGMAWQVKHEIRLMIDFRPMNLIEPWLFVPSADVVFLRNVLIYFDVATKKEILAKVRRILQPDGSLFLGGSESALGLDDSFKRLEMEQTSVYRLR